MTAPGGDRSSRGLRAAAGRGLVIAALAAAICGCAAPPPANDGPIEEVLASEFGSARTIGTVAFDGRMLPLSSPDGSALAVPDGMPPDWSVLLAQPGAGGVGDSLIRLVGVGRGRLAPIAIIDAPVLLGRSADARGFLVEAPREDGSRDIGRIDWAGRSIEWLARDGAVNAFAALGPSGELAWCRRAVDATAFDLVVRRGGNDHVVPAEPGTSWLLPTFSSTGDRIHLFRLRDDALELAMLPLGATVDGPGFQAVFEPLGRGCSAHTAWQCLASQPRAPWHRAGPPGGFIFYHPVARRVAIWSSDDRGTMLLPDGSIAAIWLDEERLAIAFSHRLVVQPLDLRRAVRPVLDSLYLPLPTTSRTAPFLLLSPDQGRVRIVQVLGAGVPPDQIDLPSSVAPAASATDDRQSPPDAPAPAPAEGTGGSS